MKIGNGELVKIYGGAISTSSLNAIARLINTLLDWGRTIGSALYRYTNKNYCR